MILLTQEAGQIQPMGWVLIIGFVLVLILAVCYDKKKAKKLNEELDAELANKIAGTCGNFTVTTDNKLVTRFGAGAGSGYCFFSLDEVAYIMLCRDDTTRSWVLGLYGEDKKLIKGEKFNSNKKKAAKERAQFFVKGEDIELRDFVHQYVPGAKLVGKYFKEL